MQALISTTSNDANYDSKRMTMAEIRDAQERSTFPFGFLFLRKRQPSGSWDATESKLLKHLNWENIERYVEEYRQPPMNNETIERLMQRRKTHERFHRIIADQISLWTFRDLPMHKAMNYLENRERLEAIHILLSQQ